MKISNLDHLVLTVADLGVTVRFYTEVLGMRVEEFGGGRLALHYGVGEGVGKINLHEVGKELEPKAGRATAGSGDLCFLTSQPIEVIVAELEGMGVSIELGPVERTGARGRMDSVYLRDPDGNLVEVSVLTK